MAQNLASLTTLSKFKALVRAQTGTLSEQASGIPSVVMNDIVHYAIVLVRDIMGKFVDDFYRERKDDLTFAGSAGLYTVNVAAVPIADVNTMTLYDPTLGEIPIVSYQQFIALQTLYSASDFGTAKGVAAIYLAQGTPSVLTIALYTNAASMGSTTQLSYLRTPRVVTTEADTVDIPEFLVPVAVDVATMYVFRRLSKQPPVDVEGRVSEFLKAQLGQINFQITPQGAFQSQPQLNQPVLPPQGR